MDIYGEAVSGRAANSHSLSEAICHSVGSSLGLSLSESVQFAVTKSDVRTIIGSNGLSIGRSIEITVSQSI